MAKGNRVVGFFITGLIVIVLLILSGLVGLIVNIPIAAIALLMGLPVWVPLVITLVISILVLGWVFTTFMVRRKK